MTSARPAEPNFEFFTQCGEVGLSVTSGVTAPAARETMPWQTHTLYPEAQLNALLAWFEAHPGLATWIQGLGSLIAIAVAIWVPARMYSLARKEAEQERKLRTRRLALRIGPALKDVELELKRIRNAWLPQRRERGESLEVIFHNARLDMPQPLAETIGELYLFRGEIGNHLQQLVSILQRYSRIWEIARRNWDLNARNVSINDSAHDLISLVDIADALLAKALEGIAPIYDGKA
ncbi:MAG: hypothetical protein ACHQRJ_00315 [Alphaproteobacteria bacterium]